MAAWNAEPLGAIDRIEVVYGPPTTLYSADAIGGVIQIFTHKDEGAPVVSGWAGAGSNATRKLDASAHGSGGDLRYAFSAGREDSDGFSATRPGAFGFNADEYSYRRRNAKGQLSYALTPGHEIGAQFLHSDLRSQYDSGTGSYDVNNQQDLNTTAVYLASQFTLDWRSTVQYATSSVEEMGVAFNIAEISVSAGVSKPTSATLAALPNGNTSRIPASQLRDPCRNRLVAVPGFHRTRWSSSCHLFSCERPIRPGNQEMWTLSPVLAKALKSAMPMPNGTRRRLWAPCSVNSTREFDRARVNAIGSRKAVAAILRKK